MTSANLKDVFAEALILAASKDERIVVVDPEVARSTKMLYFRDAYPDRFFEFGVAEQNVMGVAAGLAAENIVPFAVGFSAFLTLRPIEIIRCSICHGSKNVKMIAEYAGFSDGKDGPTHMSMEDLGMMRTIPEVVVISPSDPVMTRKMIEPIVRYNGPVYVRVETEKLPELYEEDFVFDIGKSYILREGKDITIIAYGSAVSRAVTAAEELKAFDIEAEVIDAATIKPFDESTFLQSVRKTGKVVSVEDHNIYGGIATVVSEVLAKNRIAVNFIPLAVNEMFPESGPAETLRKKYGTSCNDIINAAKKVCHK